MKGWRAGERSGHVVSSPAKAAAGTVCAQSSLVHISFHGQSPLYVNPAGRWICAVLIFLYSPTLGFVPSLSQSVLRCETRKMISNPLYLKTSVKCASVYLTNLLKTGDIQQAATILYSCSW